MMILVLTGVELVLANMKVSALTAAFLFLLCLPPTLALPSLQCSICRLVVEKTAEAARDEAQASKVGVDVPRLIQRVKNREFSDPSLLSSRARIHASIFFDDHAEPLRVLIRNNVQKLSDVEARYFVTLKESFCTNELKVCPYSDDDKAALAQEGKKGVEVLFADGGVPDASDKCNACATTVTNIIERYSLVRGEEVRASGDAEKDEMEAIPKRWAKVKQVAGGICGDLATIHPKGVDWEGHCEKVVQKIKQPEVRELANINAESGVVQVETDTFRMLRHICVKKAKVCKQPELDLLSNQNLVASRSRDEL